MSSSGQAWNWEQKQCGRKMLMGAAQSLYLSPSPPLYASVSLRLKDRFSLSQVKREGAMCVGKSPCILILQSSQRKTARLVWTSEGGGVRKRGREVMGGGMAEEGGQGQRSPPLFPAHSRSA